MKFFVHLSRREKIIFYLCLAVVTAAVFYGLVIEKIIKTWTGLNLKIAKAEKELVKNYRLIEKEKEITGEYEKYITYLKAKGSKEDEASTLLLEIETLARNNNVSTTDLKPLGVKGLDFYKKYVFEVSAEAPLKALTKFIYDLQSSSKLLTVENLTLSVKGAGTDILQAKMRLVHVSLP